MSEITSVTPKELKEAWIADLRSGDYRPYAGALRGPEPNQRCCLGVLVETTSRLCPEVRTLLDWQTVGIDDILVPRSWAHDHAPIVPIGSRDEYGKFSPFFLPPFLAGFVGLSANGSREGETNFLVEIEDSLEETSLSEANDALLKEESALDAFVVISNLIEEQLEV